VVEKQAAFGSEEKPASDAVEELQPELVLEVGDLARQRRLRGVEMLGRLGNSPEIGDGEEGTNLAEIQAMSLCR
jgi:hypothetical protein